MKRILVTGSEGFIGKQLCRRIRTYKDEYVLFTLDRSGSGTNHTVVDINSSDLGLKLKDINPDIVIHLAGNVSVKFSLENPLADFEANAMGTIAVILSALQTRCSNFIFATSGGAIYDPNSLLPVNEESPVKPSSPYGLSKLIGENYLSMLAKGKMNWTSLALSNCYGQVNQQSQGVIQSFWHNLNSGIPPIVFGSNVSRDFIFIEDVIDAFMLAIKKPANQRINICFGESVTLLEVLSKMQEILGTNIIPNIQEKVMGDVEISRLDNTLAKRTLGWHPKYSLDQGLNLSLMFH